MFKATVQEDLKSAMKRGDTAERDALRLLLAALKNAEIQEGGALDETQAGNVIAKVVKQTRSAIDEYRQLGQAEAVAKLEGELAVYSRYAPAQLSEDSVRAIVDAAVAQAGAMGPQDMGKVMKIVMPQVQGQADGALVNRLVKDALQQKG